MNHLIIVFLVLTVTYSTMSLPSEKIPKGEEFPEGPNDPKREELPEAKDVPKREELPEGQEVPNEGEISNDGKEEKQKRDTGKIIDGAALSLKLLKTITPGTNSREIAIGVENESNNYWSESSGYFYAGGSDTVPPHSVPRGKALIYSARKTSGSFKGAVGVFAYRMSDGNTLAVLFSVPYSYFLHSNWWNVKVYHGHKPADYNMYYDMYHGSPFKGDNHWHRKDIGHGLKVRGCMTDAAIAALEIHVENEYNQ